MCIFSIQYPSVTDRRTDRRRDGRICHNSIAICTHSMLTRDNKINYNECALSGDANRSPLFLRRNRNPNLTPTLGMWTRNQQAATQYREYYCAKFRVIVMRSFYTPWQSDRIIVAAVLRGMKVEWQMQRELAKDDMTRLCWTQKGQRRMETPRKDVINLLYSSIVWVYPVAIVEKFKLFIIKFEKAQKSSRTNFKKTFKCLNSSVRIIISRLLNVGIFVVNFFGFVQES